MVTVPYLLLLPLLPLRSLLSVTFSATDPNDLAILNEFKKNVVNSDLLNWPDDNSDPCGPPKWDHVFCSASTVSQIQVQELGLIGPFPHNLNQLSQLSNIGLQRNHFSGPLPSLNGLSQLKYHAY